MVYLVTFVCGFEISTRPGTLGMNDAFRYPLTIEMGQFLDQMDILHQDRSFIACGHAVLIVSHLGTKIGSECILFRHGITVSQTLIL